MIGWHRAHGGSEWHWGSLVAGGLHTSGGQTLAPPVIPLTQDRVDPGARPVSTGRRLRDQLTEHLDAVK